MAHERSPRVEVVLTVGGRALHQARNYQVGPEIARGGMGVVLEARNCNLDRKVAMKVVVSGQAASRESRLRFIREARVLGQLEHPNIVPIHELGIDPSGRVFNTMKRIQGLTLHQVLKEIQSGNPQIITQYPLSHSLAITMKNSKNNWRKAGLAGA